MSYDDGLLESFRSQLRSADSLAKCADLFDCLRISAIERPNRSDAFQLRARQLGVDSFLWQLMDASTSCRLVLLDISREIDICVNVARLYGYSASNARRIIMCKKQASRVMRERVSRDASTTEDMINVTMKRVIGDVATNMAIRKRVSADEQKCAALERTIQSMRSDAIQTASSQQAVEEEIGHFWWDDDELPALVATASSSHELSDTAEIHRLTQRLAEHEIAIKRLEIERKTLLDQLDDVSSDVTFSAQVDIAYATLRQEYKTRAILARKRHEDAMNELDARESDMIAHMHAASMRMSLINTYEKALVNVANHADMLTLVLHESEDTETVVVTQLQRNILLPVNERIALRLRENNPELADFAQASNIVYPSIVSATQIEMCANDLANIISAVMLNVSERELLDGLYDAGSFKPWKNAMVALAPCLLVALTREAVRRDSSTLRTILTYVREINRWSLDVEESSRVFLQDYEQGARIAKFYPLLKSIESKVAELSLHAFTTVGLDTGGFRIESA